MVFLITLGNIGQEYARTRHNAGWMFADFLLSEHDVQPFTVQKRLQAEVSKNSEFIIVKPQTYMNASGQAAQAVLHFYKGEGERKVLNGSAGSRVQDDEMKQVFVIHDDLDIPLGSFKIQFGTGPKVHNGVNSVRQHLGTDQFWYVRIGVDSRAGVRTLSGSDYVLQPFTADEQVVLERTFPMIWQQVQSRISQT